MEPRVLEIEGRLQVVETLTRWGAYAGETIRLDGADLGVLVREHFQPGAAESFANGVPPSESFDLARVRVRVELLP